MPLQSELDHIYQEQETISEDFYPKAQSRKRRAIVRALRFIRLIRNERGLDIGCGGGFFVNAFRMGGGKAIGVDINANAIAYARRAFPKCQFVCSSVAAFRPQEQYDFIYCSEVLEHVSNPRTLMELLNSASALGGYVFITTPDSGSPNVPQNAVEWGGFAPPAHVCLFNESNLRRLFSQYGFSLMRKMPDKKTGLKVLFRNVGYPFTSTCAPRS